MRRIVLYIILFTWFLPPQARAQNAAARYEIDAKRIGVAPDGKEALPRSREFIRLDSTYYVGYLLEGLYRYERASDYTGYRRAIPPLKKALALLDKDYGTQLQNLFSSFGYFQQHAGRFNDFYMLANALKSAYNITETPDSSMAVLDKIDGYGFQKDFFNTDSERAWLYHRNRFFTPDKHPFLKNSLQENERMAFYSCYKQLGRISSHKQANDYWFGPAQSEEDVMTTYHYLALLHNYNKNYDSSEYYYRELAAGGRVSWGNYGHLREETGDFVGARNFFSRTQYSGNNGLSETDYYLPSLLVYAGETKRAISMAHARINESGSTPGFGWYNIALARAYLYDGQLDSCDFYLSKAARFRELHINTTLTQSQYEFTISLLNLQLTLKRVQLLKFVDKGWWYSPKKLVEVVGLKFRAFFQEYALVSALSGNPERQRIVYDLFCGESTVTFDESLFLFRSFSRNYFIKKYRQYLETDPRDRIRPYFLLVMASLNYESGNKDEAGELCIEALNKLSAPRENDQDPARDAEKLLLARLLEITALCGRNNSARALAGFCETYPQLAPFSGCKLPVDVRLEGEKSVCEDLASQLKEFNIENSAQDAILKGVVKIVRTKNGYQAAIRSQSSSGKVIAENNLLLFTTSDDVATEIMLRLFGKGGAVWFEKPAVTSDVAPRRPV
jgi:hypothetical protein